MSLWKKIAGSTIADRLVEERIYELVLQEIESGERRGGLWLKAIESSRGDEKQAKLLYIRYRVQSMKDEIEVSSALRAADEAKRSQPVDRLNGYDDDGHTPLMKAVLNGDLGEVQLLLNRGAMIHIKDNAFGTSTAIDMASLRFVGLLMSPSASFAKRYLML